MHRDNRNAYTSVLNLRRATALTGRKLTEKTKGRISESKKGKHTSSLTEFRKGHLTSETIRNKISESMTGKIPSKETRKKIGLANKGKPSVWKGKHLSKEHIRNCLQRREKSSFETRFENIINKLSLPYKFVGNGMFFIERKNPDFINVNGEKIAVEVYHSIHKSKFRDGRVEDWKKDRQDIFNKYGWKIEFFDETQINEEEIKRRLGGGLQ